MTDFELVRAENPGPFTLSGTNSWLIGRDPAFLIDPGPALPEHLDALERAIVDRGGLGAMILTHDHADHAEAVRPLRRRIEAPLAAARGQVDVLLTDGEAIGPFTVVASPGHAPDHIALVTGGMCFSGDAVLGEGSVFIAPAPGSMSGYLRALRRLRVLDLDTIHPGHGPLVEDPRAKLDEYIAHRLEREQALRRALDDGLRGSAELLDRVWADAVPALRPAAAVTLEAHLGKLEEEGALPAGVERVDFSWL
ncbi:MAG: MBL fold metallo-hydrolase [Solirubrobacteraceae bacterium]